MARIFQAEQEIQEMGAFISQDISVNRAFIITAAKRPAQVEERQAA